MEHNHDREDIETRLDLESLPNKTIGIQSSSEGSSDCGIFDIGTTPEEMARRKMNMLSMSQLQTMIDDYGIRLTNSLDINSNEDDKVRLIERIMDWRTRNGDFLVMEPDDIYVTHFLPEDYFLDTLESIGLLFSRSDLQLECLLRNIDYQQSDTKGMLITKLIDAYCKAI